MRRVTAGVRLHINTGWSGSGVGVKLGVEGVPGFGLYLSWDLQLLTLAALHHSRLTHVHQEPVAEARPRERERGGGWSLVRRTKSRCDR